MRFSRSPLLGFLFLLVSVPLTGRQATTTDTQATLLLQRALIVLTGGTSISDVTLSGTVRRIAGSDDETGTATLKAMAGGASRMDLSLPSGQRSEIQNWLNASPAGAWCGPDGVSHPISYHNLMTDPSWFFPAFPVYRALSASGYAVANVGQETRDGQSVQHVQVWQVSAFQTPLNTPTLQHLSQMDFYLDSTNLLPAALTFDIHPDNNALLDIPVEIRFAAARQNVCPRVPVSLGGSHVLVAHHTPR